MRERVGGAGGARKERERERERQRETERGREAERDETNSKLAGLPHLSGFGGR